MLVKDHPGEIFSNFILSPWSPCQKRRPWVNFFITLCKLFVSPWSPCRNATYISEKIYFARLTKDHSGEILINFTLSPWSPCHKRRPWVNFFSTLKLFFVNPWAPNYVYAMKDHPVEIFVHISASLWCQCWKLQHWFDLWALHNHAVEFFSTVSTNPMGLLKGLPGNFFFGRE